MIGWIVAILVAAVVVAYFLYQKLNNDTAHRANTQENARIQNQVSNTTPRPVQMAEKTETGSMIYFANDKHGRVDKEYRFNYKKINGVWRAYILRMPDLNGRDSDSVTTHRLWDENNNPYICWRGTVTSLKDMQIISRVWADNIQEYIATGKRFG